MRLTGVLYCAGVVSCVAAAFLLAAPTGLLALGASCIATALLITKAAP